MFLYSSIQIFTVLWVNLVLCETLVLLCLFRLFYSRTILPPFVPQTLILKYNADCLLDYLLFSICPIISKWYSNKCYFTCYFSLCISYNLEVTSGGLSSVRRNIFLVNIWCFRKFSFWQSNGWKWYLTVNC